MIWLEARGYDIGEVLVDLDFEDAKCLIGVLCLAFLEVYGAA